MTFSIIPKDDRRQSLRIQRTLLAMGMAGIYFVTCCAMYYQGLFRLSFTGFIILSMALWIGHFSILTIIRSGFNKRFADPSLTFVQILWTATCIMLTAYFLTGLRPVVLMLFLVGMLFGFLRLNFREFICLNLYAIILYGAVIGLLSKFHPQFIDTNKEIIVWFSFSLVTFCFSLMGREISRMRERLRAQNVQLHDEVDERKKVYEEMQFRKAYFEGLVDNMPDGIAIFDDNGTITEVNSQFIRMFGYSEEEALGKNISELVGPSDRLEEAHAFRRRITSGEAMDVETVRESKDGTLIDVSLRSASVIVDNTRSGHFVIYRDITPRKLAEEESTRLESQIQQSRKMEAIATLAGGIAHEFNNALMGIMGNIELLKIDLPEDEGRDKSFEAMKGSGYRMSRLTDQLLAYAQGGKYQPRDLKFDDFVIETLPILQHDLNPTVRVETHFPKDISYIKADYTQMQMVLSAILANSNEAIEDKGLIKITAGSEDFDEDSLKDHPGLKPGPYVCLSIEDDGKGMDEETRNGIFEPFFTTKFHGRGMAMAAVYGIVKNHDGRISVDSELGKGTVVRIYLPAVEVEVEKEERPKIEPVKGTGTILVIEDEDVVIEVTRGMLEWLGYRVIVAKTGKDAIRITETFDGQIDLALLDIKLPDMEGGKVYPYIMEARPNLKVVVFSGYAIDGPARKILDAGAEDFIQKPISLAILAEKLKKVLEGNNR